MAEGASSFGIMFNSLINVFPYPLNKFFYLLTLVLLIFVYCFLIWEFYRFISKRDILDFNLDKYTLSGSSFFAKISGGFFYFLEFLFLLPMMILISFAFFSFLLIGLIETSISVSHILLISATIISVIRLSTYYSESFSQEIAKLLPLTLLAVAITRSDLFDITKLFSGLSQIPSLMGEISIYFLFIFLLEFLLRLSELFFSVIGIKEKDNKDED